MKVAYEHDRGIRGTLHIARSGQDAWSPVFRRGRIGSIWQARQQSGHQQSGHRRPFYTWKDGKNDPYATDYDPLDDQSVERLQEIAHQRGETVEQTAQALLLSTLPTPSPAAPTIPPTPRTRLAPDDPDGTRLIRSLAGSIPSWPGHEGQVTHTTNEDIDRLLADEAMNPHADE